MNNNKLWNFPLIFLGYLMLINNVQSQCLTHSPTEYGKNLLADMIKSPPRRWSGTTVSYIQHRKAPALHLG
jgi:hypothetical protein